jgi:cobalamin-dependent methionine synthase I
MARVNFEFDDRAAKRLGQSVVQAKAREYQAAIESVKRRYAGRPVNVVKPALRQAMRRVGADFSDRQLTEYAKIISDGGNIEFTS